VRPAAALDCREQNIHPRRRKGVLSAGVCLERTIGPAIRPTLGDALLVSRQPRDRMGFGSLARQHARHQFQWNVHRIGQPFVDWRGLYGAFGFGQACQSRLFGEAHRAGIRHGCRSDAFQGAARTAVSRSSSLSLQHRFLSSSYTMVAAARIGWRGLHSVKVYSPPWLETAFEVV
jgi:hypothetical protein